MFKKSIFLFTFSWLVFSCDGVSDIFKSKKPELGAKGIVLSADRVFPLDTVIASISATNPIDGPLYYKWKKSGGRYVEPDDRATVQWIAPVEGGDYKLTVKVFNDKDDVETSRWVNVVSLEEPLVDIREPAENEYYVLGQIVSVRALAEHENGIARVRLYAKDSLVAQMSGMTGEIYEFNFKLDRQEWVGKTTLRVEAESASVSAPKGYDQVVIDVGGIIQGKHGS